MLLSAMISPKHPSGPPMKLGNMREQGVRLAATTILLFFGLVEVVAAMDIAIVQLPNGFRAVLATGSIVGGDANRLRGALGLAVRDEHGHKGLALASPGGEVEEALSMVKVMD